MEGLMRQITSPKEYVKKEKKDSPYKKTKNKRRAQKKSRKVNR